MKESKFETNIEMEKNIRKVLININEREPVKLRNDTPLVLVQKGIKNLPMYENAAHVRKNILTEKEAIKLGLAINSRDHYHGLGIKLFVKVINSLDNPRVIFKRMEKNKKGNNEYFIVTCVKDDKKNNIVVPIEIETFTRIGKNRIDINRVETVYGYKKINNIDLNDYIRHKLNNNEFKKIYEIKRPGYGL